MGLVSGLVWARCVAQWLQGVQDHLFGEGLRGVVGAGVPPDGVSLTISPPSRTTRPAAQIQADQAQPGQHPVAQIVVVPEDLGQGANDVRLSLGANCFGDRRRGLRLSGGLVAFPRRGWRRPATSGRAA